VVGSARETWQAIAPYVERENVNIDLPWLQPGAAQVRQGNGLARQGRWDLAEVEWTAAVTRFPFNNAAKRNLALAQVAREDFRGAKQTLGTLGPLRSRKQQAETLVWMDQRHRWYQSAMGLPTPEEGWAFPEPVANPGDTAAKSTAADPWEGPWWTAIPFTKPPGWSWRKWYLQPWAL
jgi:thioredoxin-like negative regulator of GroEL